MQNNIVNRMRDIGLNLGRRLVDETTRLSRNGDFREREAYGRVPRPTYAYGMLRAADVGRYFGKNKVTVCEFGVSEGAGLLNLIELAELITRETEVEFRIVGFDTGEGLPAIEGFKDHPELWNPGDFPMLDRDALIRRIDGRAELCFGDIRETVGPFVDSLSEDAPLGFISIDVDIYSGTVSSLRCLDGSPNKYLPAISVHLDDADSFFSNEWCGELAAVHEFNAAHERRKIGPDRSLASNRPMQHADWYERMWVAHVLDHEERQRPRKRPRLTLDQHAAMIRGYARQ